MRGLMYHHHVVEEYAAQLSTNPRLRRRPLPLDDDEDVLADEDSLVSLTEPPASRERGKLSARASLADEASSWSAALFPPLKDLQALIRRFHADPDCSQQAVFRHLAPLWVGVALFVAVLNAVAPRTHLHRVLVDAAAHEKELGIAVGVVGAVMVCGLGVIRGAIWCIARLADCVVRIEDESDQGKLPEAPFLLFGGFM